MKRQDVYQVIDGERDYQDSLTVQNDWAHQGHPSVAEELVMMEEYLQKARTEWVQNKGDGKCLDMMRKVVGIGVRCFESHRVPERNFTPKQKFTSDHPMVIVMKNLSDEDKLKPNPNPNGVIEC